MTDKLKLISMVKEGAKKKEIEKAKTEKEIALKKHLKYDEELLAIKVSALESIDNTANTYGSLIIDLKARIKANRAEIVYLLESSRKIVHKLRAEKSLKKVTRLAVNLGFNKSQVEILKRENHLNVAQLEAYRRMLKSTEREIDDHKKMVDSIRESVITKRKALNMSIDDDILKP